MEYLLHCGTLTDKEIKKYISNRSKLYILSIDPGIVNFCIRIERRHRTNVKTILHELLNISSSDYKTNIADFFKLHENIIKRVNIVILESQVAIRNVKMVKVLTHIDTLFRYHIYNVDGCELDIVKVSGIKYSGLNINIKNMKANKRKKILSPAVATRILDLYNLDEDVEQLLISKKKDDYSDTVMLIESFLYRYDVNETFHYKMSFDDLI